MVVVVDILSWISGTVAAHGEMSEGSKKGVEDMEPYIFRYPPYI